MSRSLPGRPRACIVTAFVLSALSCAGMDRSVQPPRTPIDAEEALTRRAEILRAVDRGKVDEALLSALGHAAVPVRVAALQALGFIGDRSVRPRLEAALAADDPQIRREAVLALGRLGDPAALDALAGRVDDADVSVRFAVAAAHGMIDDPRTAAPLLALLDDRYASVAAAACTAVARQSEASFAVDTLIRLTAREERPVTVAASRALGRLASRRDGLDFDSRRKARARMLELADSPLAEVRAAAARGLRIPSGVGEADALLLLGKDDDAQVRIRAVDSFSFPGSPLSQFLLEALVDADDRIALAAVQGLGRMRGPEVVEALLNVMIYDERVWLKTAAIPELRRVDADQGAALANGLTRYQYPEFRRAVTRLLLGRSDRDSIEYATRLYNDTDPEVRRAAIPCMAGAPGRLADVLERVIDSTDPLDRSRLAEAASWRLRDDARSAEDRREAFALLRSLWEGSLDDPAPTVSIAVLDAARRVGAEPEVRELLAGGLTFADRRVRERAAFHLRAIFGEPVDAAPPDLPLAHYLEILRWAAKPQAAIVTVERPGFTPGRFTLQLNNTTPLTSWSFARLADAGYFAGLPVEQLLPTVSVRFAGSADVAYPDAPLAMRGEPIAHVFEAGTVATGPPTPGSAAPDLEIAFTAQPQRIGEYTPFARVVQNLDGVVRLLLPGDRIVKIEPYAGSGEEPLPQR